MVPLQIFDFYLESIGNQEIEFQRIIRKRAVPHPEV